jgi:hypothetical protein
MFPYGEDGYREDIPLRQSEADERSRKRVSLREFIAFRIQDKKEEFGNIVHVEKLFQQFLVDTFSMIESQRLA